MWFFMEIILQVELRIYKQKEKLLRVSHCVAYKKPWQR